MHVTVRLFARLRELAGASELQQELPDGALARTSWESLVREHPALAGYGAAISCAVNEEYARLSTPLADGDEVAFLPPVSGGALALMIGKLGDSDDAGPTTDCRLTTDD